MQMKFTLWREIDGEEALHHAGTWFRSQSTNDLWLHSAWNPPWALMRITWRYFFAQRDFFFVAMQTDPAMANLDHIMWPIWFHIKRFTLRIRSLLLLLLECYLISLLPELPFADFSTKWLGAFSEILLTKFTASRFFGRDIKVLQRMFLM